MAAMSTTKPPLESFENHLPRHVVTGRGKGLNVAALCSANSWSRVFVVSDQGVRNAGVLERVTKPLVDASLLVGVFDAVPPEPPIDIVDTIAAGIRDSKAEVVIGLGGGSVMDATKVSAVVAKDRRDPSTLVGVRRVGKRGVPTILIPTTAGTGSEATFVAILSDPKTGNKVGVVDPCLLADIAVVDPQLTDTLPRSITAAAGMDALVHAIEGFIAKVATPVARGLAIEAARHIGTALPVVCSDQVSLSARDSMAIGSHLAGMAFANSSCCAVHALALPLGGRYPIPHGVITGCFVGEMMRHNGAVCSEDVAILSEALGWGRLSVEEFASRLDLLASSIGLVDQLRKVPVSESDIAIMATDAVAIRRLVDPNPRDVDVAHAMQIYTRVLLA